MANSPNLFKNKMHLNKKSRQTLAFEETKKGGYQGRIGFEVY